MTLTATYHRVAAGDGATLLSSPTAHVTAGPACASIQQIRAWIVYKKIPVF